MKRKSNMIKINGERNVTQAADRDILNLFVYLLTHTDKPSNPRRTRKPRPVNPVPPAPKPSPAPLTDRQQAIANAVPCLPCGMTQIMHDKKLVNDEVSASPMVSKIKTAKEAHRYGPCLVCLTVDEIVKAFVCGLLEHLENNRIDNHKFDAKHVMEIAENLRAGSLGMMTFAIDGKKLRIYDGNHRVAALVWLSAHGQLDALDRFVPVVIRISSKAVAEAHKHSCDNAQEPTTGDFACNSSYMLCAMKNHMLDKAQAMFHMDTPTVNVFKNQKGKSVMLTRVINFMLTEKGNMNFPTLFDSRASHHKNLQIPVCLANDQVPPAIMAELLKAFGWYLNVVKHIGKIAPLMVAKVQGKTPFMGLYMAELIGNGTPVGKRHALLKDVSPAVVAKNIMANYGRFDRLVLDLSRAKKTVVCEAVTDLLKLLVCG